MPSTDRVPLPWREVNSRDAELVTRLLGLRRSRQTRKYPCQWCDSSDALHAFPRGGVHCFSCDRRASNVDLYAHVSGVAPVDAVRQLAGRLGFFVPDAGRAGTLPLHSVAAAPTAARPALPSLDDAVPAAFHDVLVARPDLLTWLRNERGWTEDVIRGHQIGYDGQRFTIPVRDCDGVCRNVRRYRPRSTPKFLNWRAGFGSPPRLWPQSALAFDDVILTAGEPDALCAHSFGFTNAITTTGGEGAAIPDVRVFTGKSVAIIYDTDAAGRAGAARVAASLCDVARAVRNVLLPTSAPYKDVTDFLHVCGHSADELRALIASSPTWRRVRPIEIPGCR